MPNNCLSVLFKRIIQVENKNVGLKVGGHKHTIAPPIKKVGGGTCPPCPPLPTPVFMYECMYVRTRMCVCMHSHGAKQFPPNKN